MINNSSQIDDLFYRFIREQQVFGRAQSTIRGYEHSFHCFRKLMPDLTIEEITEERVIDFFELLKSRTRIIGKGKKVVGVKNSTLATYRNKLGSFFNWLIKKQIATSNPFKQSKAPRIIEEGRKYLTQKEIKKILWAIEFSIKWKNTVVKKRNITIILVALFCGLRKGELLGLRVEDVDLDNKIIRIRGNTSKSKRDRNISINPFLYIQLSDYLSERKRKKYNTQFLFVSDNNDSGFTEHGLKHTLIRISKCVKFSFHMHQFRHTFAANIHYSGNDIYVIQSLLGHSDIRMTCKYLRRFPSERAKETVDRLGIDNMI
jgi:integrase/recombinase XerD